MGQDVNFDNDGQEFNIALTTSGELNFLANNKNGAGNRRMVIRDDANEVGFDGRITVEDQVEIGGSGQFGSLQLKASDGVNTMFLGSSQFDATMLVGGNGHDGRIQLFDDDGNVTIDLRGDNAILNVGADGQDGDVTIMDSDGRAAIQMDGQVSQLKPSMTTRPPSGWTGYWDTSQWGRTGRTAPSTSSTTPET